MFRLIFALLLIPCLLKAASEQLSPEDEDPSFFHHVNVISGHLNLYFEDAVINGTVPISLFRTYSSSGALERTPEKSDLFLKGIRGGWLIQGGWNYLPHANLLVDASDNRKEYKAQLAGPSGNMVTYAFSHEEHIYSIILKPSQSAGQTSGKLSARTNPQNNLLKINPKEKKATLYLPDGGIRFYEAPVYDTDSHPAFKREYFHLTLEILPSKHRFYYSYDDKTHLVKITATDPEGKKIYSSVNFESFQTEPTFRFNAKSSDGKKFEYQFLRHEMRDYVHEVKSSCHSKELAEYTPGRKGIGARMTSLKLAGKEQFRVHYFLPTDKSLERQWAEKPEEIHLHIDKVRMMEAPVGPNGEMLPTAHFTYSPGRTDVRDVENLLTRYHHDSERLLQIDYFNEKDSLHSSQKFYWTSSRLSCKAKLDSAGQPLFAKTFSYDPIGNVIEEATWGNFSGRETSLLSIDDNGSPKGGESYRKKYSYLPHFNLPLSEEEEGGLTYMYSYIPDTNLLAAKFTCDKDQILIREFRFYNKDHLLIQEIVDNGISPDAHDLGCISQRLAFSTSKCDKSRLQSTLIKDLYGCAKL
jgi:hypothetical protein